MGKIKGEFKIINPPLYIIDNHIGYFTIHFSKLTTGHIATVLKTK